MSVESIHADFERLKDRIPAPMGRKVKYAMTPSLPSGPPRRTAGSSGPPVKPAAPSGARPVPSVRPPSGVGKPAVDYDMQPDELDHAAQGGGLSPEDLAKILDAIKRTDEFDWIRKQMTPKPKPKPAAAAPYSKVDSRAIIRAESDLARDIALAEGLPYDQARPLVAQRYSRQEIIDAARYRTIRDDVNRLKQTYARSDDPTMPAAQQMDLSNRARDLALAEGTTYQQALAKISSRAAAKRRYARSTDQADLSNRARDYALDEGIPYAKALAVLSAKEPIR